MAWTHCPNCQARINDAAGSCPKCGSLLHSTGSGERHGSRMARAIPLGTAEEGTAPVDTPNATVQSGAPARVPSTGAGAVFRWWTRHP